MSKETGGPAFPVSGEWAKVKSQGMTMRDYFAAKALNFCLLKSWDDIGATERAYRIADAMLKAREQ